MCSSDLMEHSWKLNTVAFSVLAIILAYMGYTTLVFLILGFAVIALKDEELTKNILDVFLLTLVISIITSLLRSISNGIYNFFAGIVSDAALDAWYYGMARAFYSFGSFIRKVFNFIIGLIDLGELVLVILFLLDVIKHKNKGIPFIRKFTNKFFIGVQEIAAKDENPPATPPQQ